MSGPLDFSGKTVLVTGGGAGIGRACLDAFTAAGAQAASIEKDPARAADLRRAWPAALVVEGDVTVAADVGALASAVRERFGKLDVLVNNVGDFLTAGPFEAMPAAEVAAIVAVNFGQVLDVTRAMIPLLRAAAPGSSIINLTSIEGHRGIPNCAVYAACKAGVGGLTKSLALELAPAGIRVNDIAPETTQTPQVDVERMIAPEHKSHIERWIPLGRFGRPEDCAGAALWLASPLAAWVTGTAVHVDGGALAAAGWYRDPRGVWTNVPLVTGNGMNL